MESPLSLRERVAKPGEGFMHGEEKAIGHLSLRGSTLQPAGVYS
jgi:hypothetical protein